MADGFAGLGLVDAGGSKLPFQAHELVLFFEWNREIVLREDGDDVARLERGGRPPRIDTLLRIGEALDCQLVVKLAPRDGTL